MMHQRRGLASWRKEWGENYLPLAVAATKRFIILVNRSESIFNEKNTVAMILLTMLTVVCTSAALATQRDAAAMLADRQRIKTLVAQNKYDESLMLAKDYAAKHNAPEIVEITNARIHLKQRQFQKALDCFDRTVSLRPGVYDTERDIARAEIAYATFTNILDDNSAMFDRSFQSLRARGNMGLLLNMIAIDIASSKASKFAPLAAYIYLQNGVPAEYEKALMHVAPNCDERRFLEAACCVQTMDTKRGISSLNKLRRTRPCALILAQLASALACSKRIPEAIHFNTEARRLRPSLSLVLLNDCVIEHALQNDEAALVSVNKFIESYGVVCLSTYKKMHILLRLGREKEAGAIIVSQELTGKPTSVGAADYFAALGGYYQDARMPKQALTCYDRSIMKAPGEPEYYIKRALLEQELWLFRDAAKDCDLALKLNPNSTTALELKKKAIASMDVSKSEKVLVKLTEFVVTKRSKPRR